MTIANTIDIIDEYYKSMGPKTDPCGTPLITLATEEKKFSVATHWYLSRMKDEFQLSSYLVMP
jgi:hypothetical protein